MTSQDNCNFSVGGIEPYMIHLLNPKVQRANVMFQLLAELRLANQYTLEMEPRTPQGLDSSVSCCEYIHQLSHIWHYFLKTVKWREKCFPDFVTVRVEVILQVTPMRENAIFIGGLSFF